VTKTKFSSYSDKDFQYTNVLGKKGTDEDDIKTPIQAKIHFKKLRECTLVEFMHSEYPAYSEVVEKAVSDGNEAVLEHAQNLKSNDLARRGRR
jgi:hypothetical protein